MGYADAEVAGLITQAGQRLLDRMRGLDDDEWSWQPIAHDDKVTIRWRLDHFADAVGGQRNWTWLGASASDAPEFLLATTAQHAIQTASLVVDRFVELINRPDVDLDQPIGVIGGIYGQDLRRGLVLHTLDELIHHAAEAALLRDLYAGR